MHEPNITIVGNVARVPKLRTVAGGAFVADFRLAATPRRLDKSTGDWSDGQTLWFGVTCWRSLAENISASLHSGDRVVVTGRLATRSWKGEDGVERQGLEVEATSVGLELSRGTATLVRHARGSASEDTGGDAGVPSGRVNVVTGEIFDGEGAAGAGVAQPGCDPDTDVPDTDVPATAAEHAARSLAA